MTKNNINKMIYILPSLYETEEFMSLLKNTLSYLDPTLNHSLEYCLYLHTNDKNREFKDREFKDMGVKVSNNYDKDPEDLIRRVLASQIFEAIYEFKGYGVLHYNLFSRDLVNTPLKLKDYVDNIFTTLETKIIETNQSDKEEFIQFKRPLVLIVKNYLYKD